MPPSASAERPPVAGHVLVAVGDDRRRAIVVAQARRVDGGSVHAVVLRADAHPLVLVETGIAVTNDRWEFRGPGLWIEAVCEAPGRHWSYGLEAFALAIDRPDELIERGYGHRTPLGWELDFVTGDGEPEETVESSAAGHPAVEVGRVDGLLLTAPAEGGEQPLHGPAWRTGWPGSGLEPWPVALPALDGPAIEVALPLDGVGQAGPVWWVGHDGQTLIARLIGG